MFFLEIIQEKFSNTSEQLHFRTVFKKIPNSSNTGKYGPEKTRFLDPFHAVEVSGLHKSIPMISTIIDYSLSSTIEPYSLILSPVLIQFRRFKMQHILRVSFEKASHLFQRNKTSS